MNKEEVVTMLRYNQQREDLPDGTTRVSGQCFVTGKQYAVVVPTDGLDRWLAGAFVQDAMPTVPREEREFLISSTSPEGWNEMFPPDEEEV